MSTLLEALKKSERARRLARSPAYRDVGAPANSFALRSVSLIAVTALVAVLAWAGWLVTRPPAPMPASPTEVTPVASAAPKSPASAPVAAVPAAPIVRAAPAATAPIVTARLADSRLAPALPAPGEAPWLSELPASFRERLPPLVVNIHVYSPNVAQRILYINNRPCRSGQEIGDGVVVEDILPDGVLLSFDHQRFRLPRPS